MKTWVKPARDAHVEQLGVARRVDRDLRDEVRRVMASPCRDGVEQFLGSPAVGGEIVVREEHRAIAQRVQGIELRQDETYRLVALLAPEILDDVAELALERAAPAGLQRPQQRALVRVEVPARQRRTGEVGSLADVLGLRAPPAQIREQLRSSGPPPRPGPARRNAGAMQSGLRLASGPPITTRLPRRRNSSAILVSRWRWLILPVMPTHSAGWS